MLVRPHSNRISLALAVVFATALFVATTGAGAAPKSKHVKFYTPSRNIYCGMFDDGGSQSTAGCEMFTPPAVASVFANGRVLIRRGAREVGNPGEGISVLPTCFPTARPPRRGGSAAGRRSPASPAS
jgi:hypothetical protein